MKTSPALAAGGLVLLAAGCGETSAGSEAESAELWQPVAQAPLSPREWPLAVAVDGRFLVIGGSDAPPCPPNAGCAVPPEPLRDGAAYDPASGEWAAIADAPVPFTASPASTAVVGSTVYALVQQYGAGDNTSLGRTFLAYDVAADRWDVLSPPAAGEVWLGLAASGGHVLAYSGSHEQPGSVAALDPIPADLLYDTSSDTWHELPPDPHGPSFDRYVVDSEAGPVLLAQDLVPDPGVEPPRIRAAVLDVAARPEDSTWTALPDGEVVTTNGFLNAGGMLVNAQEGTLDGGETNNWGRPYPLGGVLDPSTGTWSELPEREERDPQDGYAVPMDVAGARTVVSGAWALDVPTGAWSRVPSRAEDADGDELPLPTSGQAVAFADTTGGGVLFMWGGAYWADETEFSDGQLLADGWVWAVDTPR